MTPLTRLRKFNPLAGLDFSGIWLGWFLAVTSTIAFSLGAPLGKAAIGLGLTPTTLLMLRFVISILLLVGTL